MKLVTGILLGAISFMGLIYFRHYKGALIANTGLWYFLFFVTGIIAFVLIKSSFRHSKKIISNHLDTSRLQFISSANKEEINFDNCEFFNGGFSHLVPDDNVNTLNFISPISGYFHQDVKTERVVCSHFVYSDTTNKRRFISHTFSVDADTLKYYVLSNRIVLYVSKADARDYLFELT